MKIVFRAIYTMYIIYKERAYCHPLSRAHMLLLCLGTLFEELFDRGQFFFHRGQFGLQFGRVVPVMFLIVVSFLVFPTCSGYSLPPSSLKGKNGCHRKIIAIANRGNSDEGPPLPV
jgi:hypothetical protein